MNGQGKGRTWVGRKGGGGGERERERERESLASTVDMISYESTRERSCPYRFFFLSFFFLSSNGDTV